jgi:multidrug efflux pump subunit AcrA (membrane-fusion protein)
MRYATLASKLALILLVSFALPGCGALGNSSPQPLPTVVLGDNAASPQAPLPGNLGGVTASGTVVPAQELHLAFALAQQVEAVNVSVGDKVVAGQVLASLAGAEQLQATLSAAELEVFTAQQALQKLNDDLPDDQTAALQALNDAREAVRAAERKIAGFSAPAEPIDIEVASSNVALARHALEQAQKDFKPYENKPEDNLKRAALLNKLSDAQERYDDAVKKLNQLTGVIVPKFDMQQAQTELEIAQSTLKLAEDKYQTLMKGPDPADLELAQARLKNAQDQADAARSNLVDLELKAPIAGTVSQVDVHSGEWAVPGQPVIVLADLDHLRVETTDLSERDVPQVEIGQPVTVSVEALNQNVAGHVIQIAPLANTVGGDVVYKATIDLDKPTPGLRAGMSVEVYFETGQ